MATNNIPEAAPASIRNFCYAVWTRAGNKLIIFLVRITEFVLFRKTLMKEETMKKFTGRALTALCLCLALLLPGCRFVRPGELTGGSASAGGSGSSDQSIDLNVGTVDGAGWKIASTPTSSQNCLRAAGV